MSLGLNLAPSFERREMDSGEVAVIRTLIVDDDEALRRLIRLTLRDAKRFKVLGEAWNGLEAVKMSAELKPDLIMLDLKMPIMDGFEALPEIRKVSPRSVVIILSMMQASEVEAKVLELGAAAFLDKGLPTEELLAKVEKVLASSVVLAK